MKTKRYIIFRIWILSVKYAPDITFRICCSFGKSIYILDLDADVCDHNKMPRPPSACLVCAQQRAKRTKQSKLKISLKSTPPRLGTLHNCRPYRDHRSVRSNATHDGPVSKKVRLYIIINVLKRLSSRHIDKEIWMRLTNVYPKAGIHNLFRNVSIFVTFCGWLHL